MHALSPTVYRLKCQAFVPADVRVICTFSEENDCIQDDELDSSTFSGTCSIVPAFLLVMNNNRTKALSFAEVVNGIDQILYSSSIGPNGHHNKVGQRLKMTSSTLDLDVAYHIIRPACKGSRRAILVGNDNDHLGSLMAYLVDVQHFIVQDIAVLQNLSNIIIRQRFMMLCEECVKGDSLFCYVDGSPRITEGDIFSSLIGPMPPEVTLTIMLEMRNIELPYLYEASHSDESPSMAENDNFSFLQAIQFLKMQCERLPSKSIYRNEILIFENFIKATKRNIEARKMLMT